MTDLGIIHWVIDLTLVVGCGFSNVDLIITENISNAAS